MCTGIVMVIVYVRVEHADLQIDVTQLIKYFARTFQRLWETGTTPIKNYGGVHGNVNNVDSEINIIGIVLDNPRISYTTCCDTIKSVSKLCFPNFTQGTTPSIPFSTGAIPSA